MRALSALGVFLCITGALLAADDEFPKLAPFTAVRWEGDAPHVEIAGVWGELLSIDGRPVAEILAFARRTYGGRWRGRFAEDLVQVLTEMGKAPGSVVDLALRDPATGTTRVAKGVAMTEANRKAVLRAARAAEAAAGSGAVQRARREHAPGVPEGWKHLTRRLEGGDPTLVPAAKAAEDLDQLEWWIENRYSYAALKGVDWRGALDALRAALGDGIPRGAFALQLMKTLALAGDGHTRLDESLDRLLPPGYLPFLVEPLGESLVAFREDRGGFVDEQRPFLVSIDGVPTARWLEAARSLTAQASPALVRHHTPRMLRYVAWLRQELGLPAAPTLRVGLADAKGDRPTERALPLAARKPVYGGWPRTESRLLEGGAGYLRIAEMSGDEAFLRDMVSSLERWKDAKGLVIDVRGNGGGSRALLLRTLPRFLAAPRVANVAAYRLGPREVADTPEGHLSDRFLWPSTSARWSPVAREAIGRFVESFKPEWTPGPGAFSAWHYLVIEPDAEVQRFERPVAVLLDEGCFSATDVFLAAFQGLPNVKLVGTPSGGGSGRARGLKLEHSRLDAQMSSMASFRPDGRLYDGRSIEPDVLVEPTPGYWVGREDPALERALRTLDRAR